MQEKISSRFNSFSPTDYRYSIEDLKPYLTETTFVKYKAKVEAALAKVLTKRGVISYEIANEIIQAANSVTVAEVYEEEARIKHDIRAFNFILRTR